MSVLALVIFFRKTLLCTQPSDSSVCASGLPHAEFVRVKGVVINNFRHSQFIYPVFELGFLEIGALFEIVFVRKVIKTQTPTIMCLLEHQKSTEIGAGPKMWP